VAAKSIVSDGGILRITGYEQSLQTGLSSSRRVGPPGGMNGRQVAEQNAESEAKARALLTEQMKFFYPQREPTIETQRNVPALMLRNLTLARRWPEPRCTPHPTRISVHCRHDGRVDAIGKRVLADKVRQPRI
jgi:hypothetical protein